MQLLYQISDNGTNEVWRVKLLFVESKEVEERFSPGEKVSELHTKTA